LLELDENGGTAPEVGYFVLKENGNIVDEGDWNANLKKTTANGKKTAQHLLNSCRARKEKREPKKGENGQHNNGQFGQV
jgi:hypothetical protein